MSFNTTNRLLCLSSAALIIAACGGSSGTDAPAYTAAAEAARAGLVAPLADDIATDIMSWVDGKVVNEWTAEIA